MIWKLERESWLGLEPKILLCDLRAGVCQIRELLRDDLIKIVSDDRSYLETDTDIFVRIVAQWPLEVEFANVSVTMNVV